MFFGGTPTLGGRKTAWIAALGFLARDDVGVAHSCHCEERERRGNPGLIHRHHAARRWQNSLYPRMRGDDRGHATSIAA